MKNIPTVIYLQLGPQSPDETDDFNELSKDGAVSWCADKIDEHDIEYIRQAWTSVSDKLPEPINKNSESDYLLCTQRDFSQPFVGWYNFANQTWHVAHYKADSDPVTVTHWMPLPESPK